MSPLTETLARRAVERSVADRHAEYTQEMRRIVEATYDLIERTGSLDPSLRDILAHTGLSTQAFYRLFRSKDELLLVLLDDGRRTLVDYLSARMATEPTPGRPGPGLDRGGAGPGVDPALRRPDPAVPGQRGPSVRAVPRRAAGVGGPAGRSVGRTPGLAGSGRNARARPPAPTPRPSTDWCSDCSMPICSNAPGPRRRPSLTPCGSACAAPEWPRSRRDHGASARTDRHPDVVRERPGSGVGGPPGSRGARRGPPPSRSTTCSSKWPGTGSPWSPNPTPRVRSATTSRPTSSRGPWSRWPAGVSRRPATSGPSRTSRSSSS